MGDPLETVLKWIGGAGLALGLLISVAKLWALLNRGNGRRWDLQSFKEVLDAKDRDLLHSDHENERLQTRINDLEMRLQIRRDNEHRLNNDIQSVQMMLDQVTRQNVELAQQLHDCLGERRRDDSEQRGA